MRKSFGLVVGIVCTAAILSAQTADELIAKNLQAKGGIDKIKAIKSIRMHGKFQQGSFTAQVAEEAKAPDDFRQMFTIQGMTQIQAYDGNSGWQISPFQGRRDPEMLGEDDLRDISEDADFYGPLVDYKEKGNTVEYLGKDTVDGDDAYRLKVTLKNGDIVYYYFDPDTYIEIRTERQQFIRGAVRESQTDLGSFKQVNGVYYPFSISSGPKNRPDQKGTITIEKIEANVDIPDSQFKMPSASPAPAAKPGGKPGLESLR
jgi:outer membrane lipoprotein-sorting protein